MRARSFGRSRAAVLWGVGFFLTAQLAFCVFADCWRPGVYDDEYAVRLGLLRQRMAEAPDRPLLLFLGSSRMVMNIRPEVLPELRDADGKQVLPFNVAHLGSGPVMNLMLFHRLRREGIRPRWLIVEVLPPRLPGDQDAVMTMCATGPDLPILHRYLDHGRLYGRYVRCRLLPFSRYRREILLATCPGLKGPRGINEPAPVTLDPLGGDTRWTHRKDIKPINIRHLTAQARASYGPELQRFALNESTSRAYGELLDLCRQESIQVVLVVTPEGSEFRSWYPPQALQQINAWCAEVSARHHVPIIDARTWLPDEDFFDSHHVLIPGADRFTRRLGVEVLQPLVEGRGLDSLPCSSAY